MQLRSTLAGVLFAAFATGAMSSAQAAEFDLSVWEGRVPVEVFGGCRFPKIGARPYIVTLPGHEFLWLQLVLPDELADAPCIPLDAMDRLDLPAPDPPLPPRPREKEANAAAPRRGEAGPRGNQKRPVRKR